MMTSSVTSSSPAARRRSETGRCRRRVGRRRAIARRCRPRRAAGARAPPARRPGAPRPRRPGSARRAAAGARQRPGTTARAPAPTRRPCRRAVVPAATLLLATSSAHEPPADTATTTHAHNKINVAHTRLPSVLCRVSELIPVLGSQPAGDVSHKPGDRLPLLFARPAVTLATLKRAATNFTV